jgi:hypothetical protein
MGLPTWMTHRIDASSSHHPDQNAHAPCLNSATFKFDLGPFPSEDDAQERWKSLGFLLPEKAKVFFDMVEGSGGERRR